MDLSESAVSGLRWVAEGVVHWANTAVAPMDRALAASISQAATQLQTLVGLMPFAAVPAAGTHLG